MLQKFTILTTFIYVSNNLMADIYQREHKTDLSNSAGDSINYDLVT